ncbi:MAG: hypothetical protein LBS10_11105 [Gracilibacteraceae bacterium]|jgi:hypothetical protein|nr:hypothetical protein [Gracilibacteraceae bacterium]
MWKKAANDSSDSGSATQKKYIIYYKSDYSLSAVIEAPNRAKAKKNFLNTHLPGIEITAIREAAAV